MKIKKGDTVLIISGKDRGKRSKVLRAFPKELRLLVEGVNLRKKHIRPRKEGEKGQIVETPAPIDVSNVKLICPRCSKPTRVGYKIKSKINSPASASPSPKPSLLNKTLTGKQKTKIRVCKKCGKEI